MAPEPPQAAFAIVRIDAFEDAVSVEEVEQGVTVTKIVASQEETGAEVARLNLLATSAVRVVATSAGTRD